MRIVLGLLAAMALLAWPAVAVAHPLGNFTINQYSRLVIAADGLAIRYVLDMAEIPAFQERSRIDTDGDDQVSDGEIAAYLEGVVPTLLGQIDLRLDGAPAELTVTERELSFPEGQGGLSTLRLVIDLAATLPSTTGSGTYQVDAFSERLGWREVVVQPGDGIELVASDVPAVDASDELRSYPEDSLERPLEVRQATFSYRPGSATWTVAGEATPGTAPSDDLLTSLVRGELSLLPALAAIGVSMLLGAAHAVSPGHGKTLVAAYLVGTGGNLRQAMWLGIAVAVTHTVGIFILGVATLVATEFFVPERVIGWLAVIAGVTVVMLGLGLVVQQLRGRRSAHGHGHQHGHTHGHAHDNARGELSTRRLLGLGLVGGLVPSASALLVLLLAVTLDRLAFGLALIVAFGVGMALVLGAISGSVVLVRDRAQRSSAGWLDHRWMSEVGRRIPMLSAVIVLTVGVVVTVQALAGLA